MKYRIQLRRQILAILKQFSKRSYTIRNGRLKSKRKIRTQIKNIIKKLEKKDVQQDFVPEEQQRNQNCLTNCEVDRSF